MRRRPGFALALVWTALALLLPWATVGDSCADCLWSSSPSCCLQSGCPCCAHSSSDLVGVARLIAGPALSAAVVEPPAGLVPASDPRDVFHVPKTPRA